MLPEKNLPWWRHDRPWGFRFSAMDMFIFAGGALVTILLWNFLGPGSISFLAAWLD
jgi:hypothetical protein